ncbi:MAG TPA: CsbD family protein [Opitutaceae bacterium]|nr:CsbD family protein [Opitutaceae bacterium]
MNQSTHDNVQGTAKVISGAIKEKTGKMVGNPKLEAEGSTEKTLGQLQRKVGEIEKALDV